MRTCNARELAALDAFMFRVLLGNNFREPFVYEARGISTWLFSLKFLLVQSVISPVCIYFRPNICERFKSYHIHTSPTPLTRIFVTIKINTVKRPGAACIVLSEIVTIFTSAPNVSFPKKAVQTLGTNKRDLPSPWLFVWERPWERPVRAYRWSTAKIYSGVFRL